MLMITEINFKLRLYHSSYLHAHKMIYVKKSKAIIKAMKCNTQKTSCYGKTSRNKEKE